jgi:arylsulfatase A-like enzyme
MPRVSARLLFVCLAGLGAAVVLLVPCGVTRRQGARVHAVKRAGTTWPSVSWTNPPAPHTPPTSRPPGRPFSDAAVSYRGAPPTARALRATVKDANLVICVLDAARVDHFGAYGYPRPTTPNFDRLAKESLLFEQHFAQAPVTRPSTASLLTSQYPDSHGLLGNVVEGGPRHELSPASFTLEKALQWAGYRTSLYSANVAASPALGIGADFMTSQYPKRIPVRMVWDPVARFSRDLSQEHHRTTGARDARFFSYLHILPPHQPYQAPATMCDLFAGTRPPRYWQGRIEFPWALLPGPHLRDPDSWVSWGNLYDANLRWGDAALGDLVKTLHAEGLLERTLLIVTSDHGDAMREHGYGGHSGVPYDEALHIPLLIRLPGEHPPAGRVNALTQTIDVMPTLLDLYGIPRPRTRLQGKSLVPLLAGKVDRVNDFAFSRVTRSDHACYVIRDAHSTLLLFHGGQPRALYDMDADPWQTRNVIAEQPARAQALVRAFAAFAQAQRYRPLDFLDPTYRPPGAAALPKTALSARTRRQLRSLGYVD